MGYNPSHIAGIGDMVNAVMQAYGKDYMDYDLTTILLKAHTDIKTQKILLVGHSQGTFYTNAAYDYLIKDGGMDKNSIAVYNVATPADRVAGDGKYLTSSTDKVIIGVVDNLTKVGRAQRPLPPNIDLKLSLAEDLNPLGGHSFSNVYLAEAPDRIISDMDAELNNLAANSDKSECFIEPKVDTAYLLKDAGYKTADATIDFGNELATTDYTSPSEILDLAINAWKQGYGLGKELGADIFQIFNQNSFSEASPPSPSGQIAQVAGESTAVVSDNPDIQPAAAPPEDSQTAPAPQAMSYQDQLDDIQEKIDIIRQQVQALIAQQNQNNQIALVDENKISDDKNDQNQDNDQNNNQNNNENTNNTNKNSGGGYINYPKILISEIQTAGIGDDKQEFVELYNPNNQDIPLDGWYLQRKTSGASSWSTYASNNLFSNKRISANGYFLIARTGYYSGLADIFTDNPITDDNSFALKNPNGDISDKLGFGNSLDPELSATQNPGAGQSIGRKVLSGAEQDTDNNSNDFELQTLTPKAQNITYVAPASPSSPPVLKNILISEVQIEGETVNDDWVELYNPNDVPVFLSGWSIQRASDTGKIYHVKNFENAAEILGKSYFLIVRSNASQELLDLADMTCSGLELSSEFGSGNTVYLVKKQETIVDGNDTDIIDKVGFGLAKDFKILPALKPPAGQSMGRIWDEMLQEYKNTNNNYADFEIDNPTPKAQNTAYVAAPPPPGADTTAPVITLNGASELTINAGDTYTDAGASASDNVDGDITANIAVVNPVDTNTTGDYTITYNVSDAAGKHAVQVTRSVHVVAAVSKILITEIQIEGTDKYQDFIELYNPSSTDTVYLKGYRLVSRAKDSAKDASIKSWTDADSKILPGQYYLWASSHDATYPASIGADAWTSQNISSDNGIGLRYGAADTGQIIDAVGWGTFSNVLFETSAFSQNPDAGKSIQRIWDLSAKKPQDTDDNSADFHIFDATTPKAASPQYCSSVFDGVTFTQDTTLKKSCTYMFKAGVDVASGITLTVKPGVVIKFYDNFAHLTVDGTLKAIGGDSDSDKIVFTSSFDNDYGGDISPNDTVQPSPGEWPGITFTKTSANSDLENIILRYAGENLGGNFGSGITAEDGSSLSIKNSVIEKNKNNGIIIKNSSPVIDSVQFSGQKATDSDTSGGKAILIEGGNPEIKNCVFKNNYDAIYLGNEDLQVHNQPLIENNDFENNHDPVFWSGLNSLPVFSNNKASNNFYNAIVLYTPMQENITLNPDLPYLIKGIFSVPQNMTLTINPGVVMDFQDNWAGLSVDGTLNAIGTSSNPIIFTQYPFTLPGWTEAPGDWCGLSFTKTSVNSDLENIDISFGGALYPDGKQFGAAVRADQSSISLKNSQVHDNANNGVWFQNSPSIIDHVQFSNHRVTSGPFADAVFIQGGSPEIKNSVFQHQTYGIYKDNWTDPDTGTVIPPTPNLHTTDPDDPEKNTFSDSDKTDIFDNTIPPLPPS